MLLPIFVLGDQRQMKVLKFIKSAFQLFIGHHGTIRSAAMTYFSSLALIPFLILISSIAGKLDYIGLLQDWLIEWETQYELSLPLDTLIPILNNLKSVNFASLGVIGSTSLFITFWFLLQNLEANINSPWECKSPRPMVKRFGLFAPFMAILFGSTMFISGWLEVMRHISKMKLGLFIVDINQPIWAGSSILIILAGILWIFLFFCYATLPRTKVLKIYSFFVSLGTAVIMSAAIGWFVFLESWMLKRYSVIYGSIAILPIVAIGLYVLWLLLLLGNTINLQFHLNVGWTKDFAYPCKEAFKPKGSIYVPTIQMDAVNKSQPTSSNDLD